MMPQWWFDWSGWVFGLIGAAGVLLTWYGWTRPKTVNTITGGSGNTQQGGKGSTQNTVTKGDKNSQSG